ncbi:flavohemoglobin expression-modulating QEGLA motif protein [Changchengzhania lutea]|uniref:flavohemoglobin expression-modulating QEGLA motif protein n=1 Tax=Changchengzhania lutea TaxID=2049305 RepID=UPI00115F2495|nr:flavohemoglobin expression-modulating QEGLA motif protein [Changchengzhania lutea]
MLEENTIEDQIIEQICGGISHHLPLNQILPKGGLLHIDKLLPYICVFRYKKPDVHFARLLKTQASYIIVDETIDISPLLRAIKHLVEKKFETFLILEFWPDNDFESSEFKISCPKAKAPGTLKALQEGFESLSEIYPNLSSSISTSMVRHPKNLSPLLNDEDAKKSGILVIGVSIPVLYKNLETDELYSLFFRQFHIVFSETVKRAAYEFIRIQNSDHFNNYLILGKTHISEVTAKADRELAEINEGMSFLLRATPVNSNEEWKRFRDNNFKETPSFKYRLIALDPELEKRKLYNLPIDDIEDPTIAYILRGKRLEIEKQLTMLEERGTKNFRFVGESLYGVSKKNVIKEAKKILKAYPKSQNVKNKRRLNCHEFAALAKEELHYYNEKFPDIELSLEIRNDIAGIMVSKSKLLINDEISFDEGRADALIQHEVGTHILTYCNGKRQPLCQMYEGFEGYDQLQEGLAVIAEFLVGGLTVNRLRLLAGRVMAVKSMTNGADFIETFNLLRKKYAFSDRISYYISMRVYRGGGLTKDAVYLAGLIDVLKYLKEGGNLQNLYTGKFNLNHIDLIEELLHRGVLKQPELPRFLERKEVKKRLKHLRRGIEITELTN